MTLRNVFFWLHLTAGVVAGAVILLMSATGVALTYERQMIEWSNREFQSTPTPGAQRMTVEQLVTEFRRQRPGQEPTGVTVESDPTEPVAMAVGPQTIYVDAYSGRVLGPANQGMRETLSDLRSWHRWLAYEGPERLTARAITGWSNVLFLFVVASGIYMWFPRRWTKQSFRAVGLFKSGVRGKARDFNWHNVIGIWSAVPLLIVVASAVPISFPWGNDLVYRLVGEEPPAPRGGGPGRGAAGRGGAAEGGEGRGRAGGPGRGARAEGGTRAEGGARAEGRSERGPEREREARPASIEGLTALMAQAQQREADWTTINLRLPASSEASAVFAIDRGDGGQPQLRSTLTLSRAGDVVSYENFSSQSTGRQIRSLMRFAHTGEVLGLPGQTVAGLVSAGGVVLVWTGIALALRRLVAWTRRRRNSDALEPASARNPAA